MHIWCSQNRRHSLKACSCFPYIAHHTRFTIRNHVELYILQIRLDWTRPCFSNCRRISVVTLFRTCIAMLKFHRKPKNLTRKHVSYVLPSKHITLWGINSFYQKLMCNYNYQAAWLPDTADTSSDSFSSSFASCRAPSGYWSGVCWICSAGLKDRKWSSVSRCWLTWVSVKNKYRKEKTQVIVFDILRSPHSQRASNIRYSSRVRILGFQLSRNNSLGAEDMVERSKVAHERSRLSASRAVPNFNIKIRLSADMCDALYEVELVNSGHLYAYLVDHHATMMFAPLVRAVHCMVTMRLKKTKMISTQKRIGEILNMDNKWFCLFVVCIAGCNVWAYCNYSNLTQEGQNTYSTGSPSALTSGPQVFEMSMCTTCNR